MKKKKRFLSVLLSLALILGLMLGMSLTARALDVCPDCGSANITYDWDAESLKCNACHRYFEWPDQRPDPAYYSYLVNDSDDADALAEKAVQFNGIDWYVIEDNTTEVNVGTLTLLAKDPIGQAHLAVLLTIAVQR